MSIVDITGIAARRVGVCIGLIFIALAFFPKATAVLLAIPDPVVGAYIIVLIAILFVLGVEMVAQGRHRLPQGHDHRRLILDRRRLPERPDSVRILRLGRARCCKTG